MSDAFEAYQILLNSQPESQRKYEVILIKHPDIETRYFVYDSVPLVAALPDGTYVEFQPLNFSNSNAKNSNDMDQSVTFTVPDIDNELDDALDLIPIDTDQKAIVGYGIYHSDYLDEPAEYVEYEINDIPQEKGVFSIKAGAPTMNRYETGAAYDLDIYWPLRGLA